MVDLLLFLFVHRELVFIGNGLMTCPVKYLILTMPCLHNLLMVRGRERER